MPWAHPAALTVWQSSFPSNGKSDSVFADGPVRSGALAQEAAIPVRTALTRFALLLAAFLVGLVLASTGQAEWRILHYDKNGRIVGVSRGEADGQRPEQGAPASRQYEEGEILVANPPRNFESNVRQLGFQIIEKVSLRSLETEILRLRIPQGASVPAAVRDLQRRFPGLTIDANHLVNSQATKATPEVQARNVIGWRAVAPTCGRGVKIGMIDGAVDTKHPALVGQGLDYRSFHDPKYRAGSIDHGTAIAGALIGRDTWGGIIPAAELKAANIFQLNDRGKVSANIFALVRAVDWMVEERVHVLNVSVAGSHNRVLRQVLDKAHQRGIIMVAAAGNNGRKAKPAYPAAYEQVIAVTAIDGKRRIYKHANQGAYIDFAAPGVRVWTAVPGGGRFKSGTSFAAPYVSALVGLQVARGRARSPSTARNILRRHTIDLGTPGRDDVFGWGLVGLERNCNVSAGG